MDNIWWKTFCLGGLGEGWRWRGGAEGEEKMEFIPLLQMYINAKEKKGNRSWGWRRKGEKDASHFNMLLSEAGCCHSKEAPLKPSQASGFKGDNGALVYKVALPTAGSPLPALFSALLINFVGELINPVE